MTTSSSRRPVPPNDMPETTKSFRLMLVTGSSNKKRHDRRFVVTPSTLSEALNTSEVDDHGETETTRGAVLSITTKERFVVSLIKPPKLPDGPTKSVIKKSTTPSEASFNALKNKLAVITDKAPSRVIRTSAASPAIVTDGMSNIGSEDTPRIVIVLPFTAKLDEALSELIVTESNRMDERNALSYI